MITVQEMIRFSCNTVVYMDNELASSESQAHLFFYREINKFNSLFHRARSYGWRASPYRRVSNLFPFRLYSINLKTEDSIALLKLYTSFMAQSVSKMKPPGWQRTGFSRSKRSNVSTYEVKNVQWLSILRPKCHEICVLWLHIHKFTFPL